MSWLPEGFDPEVHLSWSHYAPEAEALLAAEVNTENVVAWLDRWSEFSNQIDELSTRLSIATSVDTTDENANAYFQTFLDELEPEAKRTDQKLKEKFLATGLTPPGFEIPVRNLRSEASLFRETNVPLESEEAKLTLKYDEVIAAQTVHWEGNEITLARLEQEYKSPDRERRERAWHTAMERRARDRGTLNELWVQFLDLRDRIAANAGYPSFLHYQWEVLQRFDYTPDDCKRFHDSIEEVVVPAAKRIQKERARRLGLETLRPWDLAVDPEGRGPLKPFQTGAELENTANAIFDQVDPALGEQYRMMQRTKVLDLENRKGKAPGGYCTYLAVQKLPFIFMNAVGSAGDVMTLLHEAGHAFHAFEASTQGNGLKMHVNTEFCEVASMSMELLAHPYLEKNKGGYYSEEDAIRARRDHLEKIVLFWPYMAVVDAFQHWVYAHPADARDATACDQVWSDLWDRFMSWEDWTGLEFHKSAGWHRKLHIYQVPLYYVEYGIAQLGAIQVWRNSLRNQGDAVAQYRRGLALAGTATLPELFAAAGAEFKFDAETIRSAVELIEEKHAGYLALA